MNQKLWKRCVAFHGHACGGLAIGCQAALYAVRLLELAPEEAEGWERCISADEEVVCIAENDACGVDAIQVLLGCSVGKGNLLFHMTGKQAFSFYSRRSGKSVRLVLKPKPRQMTREESFAYYQSREPQELFEVKKTTLPLPEKAGIFQSVLCSQCQERVSENLAQLRDGKYYCLDCCPPYDRFRV